MSSPDLRPNVKAHLAMNAAVGKPTMLCVRCGCVESFCRCAEIEGVESTCAPTFPLTNMTELATALGVARPALSRYLGGRPNPAGVTLVQVADALGVPVDSLVWMGRQ